MKTTENESSGANMVPIREYYVIDKECKHSVRYKPRTTNSPLAGMTIYVPKQLIRSERPPLELTLSLEVHAEAPADGN